MRAYLDASILASALVNDTNSARASGFLLTEMVTVVSDFAALETVSTIAKNGGAGLLSKDETREALSYLDLLVDIADERPQSLPDDLDRAAGFIRRLDLNLRAPDAINLAIAFRVGATVATFDAGMAACATALGIDVAPA